MAMGERTPLAALDAPASGRMAVGEALTNLLGAPVALDRVKLSANWMAACGEPGEDAALYDTVRAVVLIGSGVIAAVSLVVAKFADDDGAVWARECGQ
jgi:phosphoribosylformylglycinamidine (FGAM) synthase-like enzyme